MSSYELTAIDGVTARQLDWHRLTGGKAAVYALPEDGRGMIIINSQRWNYASPSAALAAWYRWLASDAKRLIVHL